MGAEGARSVGLPPNHLDVPLPLLVWVLPARAAFYVFLASYGTCLGLGFFTPYLNLGWVYDHFVPLMTASLAYSALQSVYLYASSFKRGALLSSHGSTGYAIYDFWMGRELNPRVGGLDLKEFCELYPGLIGWAVINLAMAHKQYSELGYVTNAVVLVNAFHLYYVVDALWNEKAILTTMDITTDGFGFMLAFGDLAWVPFTYSTTTRFLVDFPRVRGRGGRGGGCLAQCLGPHAHMQSMSFSMLLPQHAVPGT